MPTTEQPVTTTQDVLGAWSADLSLVQVAPVRDAIVSGQLASQEAYQDATAYAAAQSDSLQATDEYLDEIGSFEHGIQRATGEQDIAYRARILDPPTPCDPNDIIAAANAILSPFTNISCRYAERSDGCFPGLPTSVAGFTSPSVFSVHAFADPRSALFTANDGSANATPNYPDRLYSLIPSRRPPGCMPLGYGGGPATWPIVTNYMGTGLALPGTASFTNGIVTVTGIGTNWLTTITKGQWIQVLAPVRGLNIPFVSVQVRTAISDTSLALALPWLGSTVTGCTLFDTVGAQQAQGDEAGRWFLLRVPDITGIDSNVTSVYQLGNPQPPENPSGGFTDRALGIGGLFPGNTSDGTSAVTGCYVFNINQTSTGVYQSIVDSVEAIRGHGIRWTMLSDPFLTA